MSEEQVCKEIIEQVGYQEFYRYFQEKTTLIEQQRKEIERLNKKIEQYENPEDMTLMFMWCDEKAKDEIKRLNNIIKELEDYMIGKDIYKILLYKLRDLKEDDFE